MKKVYKNLFTSVLPQLVNLLINFILPGLIIAKFGSEINGLVSTTKSIISYISIVGAGIATAVTQSFYGPVAKKDTETIKGMLSAANRMFVKYGIIYVVITIVVALLYPFFIKTDINFITIALLLVVMSLSGASEFFVTGRCRALLYADQKVYICNTIQAVSLLISLFAAFLMLRIDVNIVIVELAISFVYVIRAAVLLGYVNYKYPELRGFKKTEPIKRTVEKRKDAMIHYLSGLAISGSQSLILSIFVSLEAASIYAVYSIVFGGLQSISASLSTSVTPYLGKEISLKREESSKKMYNMIELGCTLFVSFVFFVATFMIVPFIRLYTVGADINYAYKDFAILFAFLTVFYILKMPGTAAINAAGHFAETKSRALIEASICIICGIGLTFLLGQSGCLIGTLLALGWRCFDTVFYANKHILKMRNNSSIKRIIACLIITSISAVLSIIYDITPNGYWQWIAYACVASLVALLFISIYLLLFEMDTLKKLFFRSNKIKTR